MEVIDIPEPGPAGPGEVLVKVAYCGICGSDLRAFQTWNEERAISRWGEYSVLGHEFSGTIVEVGEGVTDFKPGDRVAAMPAGFCGECFWCRRRQWEHCPHRLRMGGPGGFTEYVRMPHYMVRPLPDGVDLKAAALTEPLAVTLKGVRLGELGVGEDVLIFGAGPIGLLLLQGVKLAGAGHITVVEPSDKRRQLAAELGADLVIDPKQGDLESQLPKYRRLGPDVVFECSGVAAANQQALDLVRPAGRVVMVGGIPEPVQINLIRGPLIRVSIVYDYSDFDDAIELISTGKVNVEPLITAVIPLERGPEGFRMLDKDREHIKILIEA